MVSGTIHQKDVLLAMNYHCQLGKVGTRCSIGLLLIVGGDASSAVALILVISKKK